ncbi:MAG TPA: hypothetical protein VLL52_02005 [Anaerolineae bacterium]|nr:hypothetical protein [Anaerolineae bacterium]
MEDFNEDYLNEPAESSGGSSFIAVIGILTSTLVIAVLCIAVVWLVRRSGTNNQSNPAVETRIAENNLIATQNSFVTATYIAIDQTEAAIAAATNTPTPTSTSTPVPTATATEPPPTLVGGGVDNNGDGNSDPNAGTDDNDATPDPLTPTVDSNTSNPIVTPTAIGNGTGVGSSTGNGSNIGTDGGGDTNNGNTNNDTTGNNSTGGTGTTGTGTNQPDALPNTGLGAWTALALAVIFLAGFVTMRSLRTS